MNENAARASLENGIKVPFAFLVIFRLALLVGPLTLAVLKLGHAPLVCAAICLSWLGVWLSVDVWPFRAATPKAAPADQANAAAGSLFAGITKTQWWSCLFCSVIVFLMVLRSKLQF